MNLAPNAHARGLDAAMAALLLGCRAQLDRTNDRPQKAGPLSGYRGCNDSLVCGGKQAITGATPDRAFQEMSSGHRLISFKVPKPYRAPFDQAE